jgi:hypothetical protein
MSVKNVSSCKFALVIMFVGLAAGACSSSGSGGNDAGAGSGGASGGSSAGRGGGGGTTGVGGTTGAAGTTGRGGTTGGGGTAGSAGSGATGRGGTTGSAGATGTAGTMGTQPIGAACANTSNCSQADGEAICCLQSSTCVLATQCPGGPNYIPCTDDASCNKGGWICCKTSVMNYCTKSNGCVAP